MAVHRSAGHVLELLSKLQVQVTGRVHSNASVRCSCCAALTLVGLGSAGSAHAVQQTAALTAGLDTSAALQAAAGRLPWDQISSRSAGECCQA